jgi:heme exporter protein B
MLRAVGAILRKDLLLELRTRESVPAMAIFGVTTLVVFHFALNQPTLEGDLAAGVLWVSFLFAAMLGLNRLFVAEEEQGGFDGFLMAPIDRTSLYVAKALALMTYLAIVQIVAVPAFALLLLEPGIGPALPGLVLVLVLGDLGICAVGALVSAIGIRTRARDLIVPLLALPLLIPVVISAVAATAPLLAADGAEALPGRWLLTLALYDAVFAAIAYAVFDDLLED